MGQLTDDMIRKLSGFRADIIAALTADLGAGEAKDAISAAGACSLTRVYTELTISGTKAYTLAAPTAVNQRKVITCVSAASTPAGTLTVTSPDDTTGFVCPATFFFDNVGQEITLIATAALKWRCINKKRTGVKTLVVGTTVTTGICDMSNVDLSITGTVSSTTTKALPNGAAVGEMVAITVSTAATTPIGTLGGAFLKKDGTAGTTLAWTGNAVTDQAILVWNGTGWKGITLTGTGVAIA
jgi:hypothetical protein